MSELIIPDGYAQVQMVWTSETFDSGGATTSFGIELGEALLDVLPEAAATAWEDNLRPITDPSITLAAVRAITDNNGAEFPVGLAGSNTEAELLAPNTSVLIRLTTSQRGRRGRGRMYWPGLAYEVQVSEAGRLIPAWQADVTEAFNAFFLALANAGYLDPVVLQRTTPTGPGAPVNPTEPIFPPPQVTGIACDERVATQRRRLRR